MSQDRATCIDTARLLIARGKGLLAADESTGSIGKRFEKVGLASDEASRRAYRDVLFSTEGIERFISGVILFEETAGQGTASGEPFPSLLRRLGIVPGIKVDRGLVEIAPGSAETLPEGLDGLASRLSHYRERGFGFAKWRAAIRIDGGRLPTGYAVAASAFALARYASLCQNAGIVPIVEPEVLMDGGHDVRRSAEVTRAVLEATFEALYAAGVSLEGMLLKPNMVIPGLASGTDARDEEVAEATLGCLRRAVPAAVQGIVFLSGGQSPEAATGRLDAMVRLGGTLPWPMTFSFGRALQEEALSSWRGDASKVRDAQTAFLSRCRLASLASLGELGKQGRPPPATANGHATPRPSPPERSSAGTSGAGLK